SGGSARPGRNFLAICFRPNLPLAAPAPARHRACRQGVAMIEPQWLTYREAAERLGITADAVARRARRHKWPKLLPNRPGNPVRIQVPGDQFNRPTPPALPPPPDAPPPDNPPPPADAELTAALVDLQAEVARLTDLAEQERRIAAIERRDRLEVQRQTEELLAQVNAAQREV